jgi:nucleotidyltransferase/DNA polymerase involved in DNA repair
MFFMKILYELVPSSRINKLSISEVALSTEALDRALWNKGFQTCIFWDQNSNEQTAVCLKVQTFPHFDASEDKNL